MLCGSTTTTKDTYTWYDELSHLDAFDSINVFYRTDSTMCENSYGQEFIIGNAYTPGGHSISGNAAETASSVGNYFYYETYNPAYFESMSYGTVDLYEANTIWTSALTIETAYTYICTVRSYKTWYGTSAGTSGLSVTNLSNYPELVEYYKSHFYTDIEEIYPNGFIMPDSLQFSRSGITGYAIFGTAVMGTIIELKFPCGDLVSSGGLEYVDSIVPGVSYDGEKVCYNTAPGMKTFNVSMDFKYTYGSASTILHTYNYTVTGNILDVNWVFLRELRQERVPEINGYSPEQIGFFGLDSYRRVTRDIPSERLYNPNYDDITFSVECGIDFNS